MIGRRLGDGEMMLFGVGVVGIYREYVADDDLNIDPTLDLSYKCNGRSPRAVLSFAIFESLSSSKGLPPHISLPEQGAEALVPPCHMAPNMM